MINYENCTRCEKNRNVTISKLGKKNSLLHYWVDTYPLPGFRSFHCLPEEKCVHKK